MTSPSYIACLLLAALALAAAVAEGTALNSWAACGGSQFCPCATANCDGQWPNKFCQASESCTRHNPTWWRCEPRGNVCWRGEASTWDRCGGKSGCPSGVSDCDAPWTGTCCKHGDVCNRQDANWWRCEPMGTYANSNTCDSFAQTWASCPTRTRVCCSNPGDVCVRQTDTWSRCEPSSSTAARAPPRGMPPPPLATDGGNRIVRVDNWAPVTVKGLNWFGFNVARSMVGGLGQGGSSAATDFGTIVYQLKLLGFNTIRLPFRYRDLDIPNPKSYDTECWTMSQEDLRRRLMEPGFWTNKQLPGNPAPISRPDSSRCNSYLPPSSTHERLMFTIQTFISQGMYVMLDYQPMGTESQAYDLQEFTCKWRQVMARVIALNNYEEDIKGRLFVDIMNEPDSMGLRWEAANGKPGARELYLATMDSLHALSPDGWLYVVEGTGQNSFGLNWGNGFITDSNIISRYGLSNANPFFSQLLDKPYVDKVIVSPHVYPPSITKAVFLGDTLWQQCDVAFGYLQTRGFCNARGKCKKFPVVIGETGSFMATEEDKQWLSDFADFVMVRGSARSYNNWPMAGWIWWTYNENSGDTGGIVYDNWQKLHWGKLGFMIHSLGLAPWYWW